MTQERIAAVQNAKCFLTTNFLLRVLIFLLVLSREAEGGWSSLKPKKGSKSVEEECSFVKSW